MLKALLAIWLFISIATSVYAQQSVPKTHQDLLSDEIARQELLLGSTLLSAEEEINNILILVSLYIQQQNIDKAATNLVRVQTLLKNSDKYGQQFRYFVAHVDLNLLQSDYILALKYAEQAQAINDKQRLNLVTFSFLIKKARILIKLKNAEQAQQMLMQIEQKYTSQINTNSLESKLDYLLINAEYQEEFGDLSKAYQFYNDYMTTFRDQNTQLQSEQTAFLMEKHETEKVQLEANLLAREVEFKKASLLETEQRNTLQTYYLLIIGVVFIALLLLLARQFKVRKQLKKMASTDSLSQVLNRRSLFFGGNKLLEEAVEQGQPLSVILFDIDNFKFINDTYGHHVGDLVITSVATCAKSLIRGEDLIGRIGGEEFVIILPNDKAKEALIAAERIRLGFLDNKVELDNGNKISYTASFGIASLDEADKFTLDALINAADKAMYQAKSQGRNRCVLHQR